MRILITGATSTIGIALANRLAGDNTCACVREGSRIDELPIGTFVRYCELADPQSYVDAIRWFKPDVVYHLAWYGSVRGREEATQITLNVPASLEIARACRDVDASLVFAGSLAEYDSPLNPYSLAKTSAGELIQMYCNRCNVPFAWARIGTVYGPLDDERHLIPRLMYTRKHVTKMDMTSGEERWDFVHVNDVAEALVSLAGREGVYDVGTGKSTSLRELVGLFSAEIGRPLVNWGAYPSVRRSDKCAVVDHIYRETGWYARVTLKNGLKETWRLYKTPRKAEKWMP